MGSSAANRVSGKGRVDFVVIFGKLGRIKRISGAEEGGFYFSLRGSLMSRVIVFLVVRSGKW